MGYVEPVPERLGKVARTRGLYFGCKGCGRGRLLSATELVRRWGEEGRVSDVVARLACSNCNAKRRGRRPGVWVEVVQLDMRGEREVMGPVDALVYDIRKLKVSRQIE